jgi:hypothetical protein
MKYQAVPNVVKIFFALNLLIVILYTRPWGITCGVFFKIIDTQSNLQLTTVNNLTYLILQWRRHYGLSSYRFM